MVRTEHTCDAFSALVLGQVENLLEPARDIDALDIPLGPSIVVEVDSIEDDDIVTIRMRLWDVGEGDVLEGRPFKIHWS